MLTVSGFDTLAPATYVASAEIDHTTNDPLDVLVEVECATTNTAAGNKQVQVFMQASIDGADFTTGPTSGSSPTDESDLYPVGVVPMNTNSATHRKTFSLAAAFGGVLPRKSKIVLRNDLGVALTSGAVQIAEVWNVTV